MQPSRSRKKAERFGHLGEALAALYLMAKFYRIRAMRMKTPVGEIDLIAQRGKTIVFVEVKTRKTRRTEAAALHAVNRHRITRAANYYYARNPHLNGCAFRFDVIFLAPFALPRHVKGAFENLE